MKTVKLLLITVFLAAAFSASAQTVAFKENTVSGGYTYDLKITNIDSGAATTTLLTSPFMNFSLIDGQTVYVTWKMLGSAANFADTLLFIIKGRYPSNVFLTQNVDTIIVTEDTLDVAGDVKVNQSTFAPNAVYPEYQVVVQEKGNNNLISGVYMSFYAKVNDLINQRKKYTD